MFFNIPLFLGATKIVVFFESKNLLEKKIRNHEKIYTCVTKLLQKSEMRKDIVIELSYKGFS